MRKAFLGLFFSVFFFSGEGYAETIPVAPMREFSGLTKAEITGMRLYAVQNSRVFGNIPDYRPSDAVFQIEDGYPWIGAYEITCHGVRGSSDIGRGESRESVGILNPELLFVINMPSFAFHSTTGCSPVDYLIPSRVDYNRMSRTISAFIDASGFYRKNRTLFGVILEDANARDLGYNHVFADDVQNIRFKESVNFSTEITQTSGFFHRGYSCGKSEGCNNYSPYESRYHFYIPDPGNFARLHIKLWKERPENEHAPADMNYELIFQ